MSGSPTEPENAAPTAPVRLEQGTGMEKQGSGAAGAAADHTMAQEQQEDERQRIHTSRSLSNSLLTRALAAQNDQQASLPTTILHDSPTAEAGDSPTRNFTFTGNNNGLSRSENSMGSMALTLPVQAPGIMPGMTSTQNPTTLTPTFLGDIDHVNSLLMSHRAFLNSRTRPRGTSLERTDKEKGISSHGTKGSSAHNPGDTALPRLPSHGSPASSTPISNQPPTEGVRARYRSWRDARPATGAEMAWSIGDDGDDSSAEGQVEKSIAEALAGIEPNVRSRKASHSLRVFKEGLPEKKREGKTRGRSKERTSRQREVSENDEGHAPKITVDSPHATSGITSLEGGSRNISGGSLSETAANDTKSKRTSGYFDIPTAVMEEDTIVDDTHPPHNPLPPQLLDEIRKHHNLTPGGVKGSSFSPSIPTAESERESSPIKPKHVDSESEESSHDDDDAKKAIRQKRKGEDEECGKEQVTSALFVPHQTPHESPDRERDSSQSPGRSRSRERSDSNAAPESWLVEHEIPTHELEKYHGSVEKEYKECEIAEDNMQTPTRSPLKATFDLDTNSEYDYESQSEAGYSTVAEDSQTDDPELTPTGRKPGQYMSNNHKKHLHDHQQISKAPAEAIELVPYRHQVGGHTTMWRFSQRAVCKQLNNRENEFYEKVEHFHPKLLKFLPRYIGVLNVTYERQKRKEPKKDGGDGNIAGTEVTNGEPVAEGDKEKSKENDKSTGQASESTAPRMISQSMSSSSSIPTVTFADNRHIIPKSFLHPLHLTPTPVSASAPTHRSTRAASEPQAEPPLPAREFTFRPSLADKHAVSWGATTVNKKLRNEVFGEAFLQNPIPVQRHRKPAHQNRALPARRTNSGHLRASNSESSLITAQQTTGLNSTKPEGGEESMRRRAMKGAAEKSGLMPMTPIKSTDGEAEQSSGVAIPGAGHEDGPNGEEEGDDKTGTSAPEPEIPPTPSDKGKKKRRYSSGALRRKPDEVQDARGHLKYFEEADDAGYKGDGEEEVFAMDLEPRPAPPAIAISDPETYQLPSVNNDHLDGLVDKTNNITLSQPTEQSKEDPEPGAMLPAVGDEEPDLGLLPSAMPRPVNPKEAQTQPDKRVEYFLLLEDLTAGMKRPCIMDLKMGTRQYGVEATEKKQKSQRRKCATTTSKELGVRVCGLQVWDVSTQSYVFQDKYFGRDLKAGNQFQDALTRFLYDGVDYSSVLRHIPTILRKLSQLEILIQGLHGYRFYAASLLMFYDGDLEDAMESELDDASKNKDKLRRKKDIDFKIADFANCVTAEDVAGGTPPCPPKHPSEPDRGFLRGLRSLRRYFEWIQRDVEEKMNGMGFGGEEEGWLEDEGEVSY